MFDSSRRGKVQGVSARKLYTVAGSTALWYGTVGDGSIGGKGAYCSQLHDEFRVCTVPLYPTVLYGAVWCCTVLYSNVQYCTVPFLHCYCPALPCCRVRKCWKYALQSPGKVGERGRRKKGRMKRAGIHLNNVLNPALTTHARSQIQSSLQRTWGFPAEG